MKNKQHEYILKAYTNSRFPRMVYEELPNMMLVFEEIDSYAIDILKNKRVKKPAYDILSKEAKVVISEYINNPNFDIDYRNEMIIFYRIAILAIEVLNFYYVTN